MELKNDNFDGGSSFFRLFGFTTPDIVGSFIGPNISWRCIFRDIQEDSRIRILHGQTLTVLVCPALPPGGSSDIWGDDCRPLWYYSLL